MRSAMTIEYHPEAAERLQCVKLASAFNVQSASQENQRDPFVLNDSYPPERKQEDDPLLLGLTPPAID